MEAKVIITLTLTFRRKIYREVERKCPALRVIVYVVTKIMKSSRVDKYWLKGGVLEIEGRRSTLRNSSKKLFNRDFSKDLKIVFIPYIYISPSYKNFKHVYIHIYKRSFLDTQPFVILCK